MEIESKLPEESNRNFQCDVEVFSMWMGKAI